MASFLLFFARMQSEWEPVTKSKLIGFGIGLGALLLLIFRSEQGFVFLLDHANLLFHEAGHPVVGLSRYAAGHTGACSHGRDFWPGSCPHSRASFPAYD